MDANAVYDGLSGPEDRRLLAELARRYGAPLRQFFHRRTRQPADVEDLVQETFLRLARQTGISNLEGIEGYLFQTAKSVMRDKARRTAVRVAANETEQLIFPSDDEVASPESVLLGREALDLAIQALHELPERTRTVFILHRFEQLQYKEIARRLGVSLSTVEKDIMKALVHIGARLGAP
jgi:RNA polymerase sigma-70 factor (ECF subfamily)